MPLIRFAALVVSFTISLTFQPSPSSAQDALKMPSKKYVLVAETVVGGLSYPWSVAFMPDGRALVTERTGALRIISKGELSAPVSGVPQVATRGQGGLLDIALSPDFANDRTLYFSFSETGRGGAGTAVARAILDETANVAKLNDVSVIFRVAKKSRGGAHFGSRLAFAPDGKLFITLGERGDRDRAQDAGDHAGSVVRIWPDGTVPPDNPFANRSDDGKAEIWSIGHRNPQSAAIHPQTGHLWTVEHGAKGGDEINAPRAGRNYGWPVISYGRNYSGTKIGIGNAADGYEQPVYYWDPSIAPSGMAFYTGELFPAWKGNLFVGALKGRHLARLTLDGEKVISEEKLLTPLGQRIRDVRQGPEGALYVLTDGNNGALIRLHPE